MSNLHKNNHRMSPWKTIKHEVKLDWVPNHTSSSLKTSLSPNSSKWPQNPSDITSRRSHLTPSPILTRNRWTERRLQLRLQARSSSKFTDKTRPAPRYPSPRARKRIRQHTSWLVAVRREAAKQIKYVHGANSVEPSQKKQARAS